MLIRILLSLRGPERRERIRALLDEADAVLRFARAREDLVSRAARESVDLVIADLCRLAPPPAETVRLLRQSPESPEVVIVAPTDDLEERTRLRAAGAAAVVYEGLADTAIRDLIRSVRERHRQAVNGMLARTPRATEPRLSDFVSASPAMRAFLGTVERVADADVSLLLLGETGTGKERLARAIHGASHRGRGRFVAVNCGAFPEALLESELFGHEEGAYTGATRARRGWFELAHGGTLFLDEIGEMPLHLQVKLLRVLQEREFTPLGGERSIRVDVRVMAASNRDLGRAVEDGTFRRDLFYRIGVVTLTLPALRDRREDVPALAASYVEVFRSAIRRNVTGLSAAALEALSDHTWPGNVRELINVIERAVLLCPGPEIGPEHLPEAIAGRRAPLPPATLASAPTSTDALPTWAAVRREAMARAERDYLEAVLAAARGRIGEAARIAGLSPRALHGKMSRSGLRKEDFRRPPA